MTPDDLQPGMYLVGREDGTVAEFFVKVVDRRSTGEVLHEALEGSTQRRLCLEHHADVTAYVGQAEHDPGWWWRRMRVFNLPNEAELGSLPPYPMERGA